jgi:hypothetical protein
VQGNHEQRNQQANLPLFIIEMMTTRMTCKSLKRGCEKLFSLFSFSNLFYLFLNFLILSNANVSKKICSGKGEKKMVDLGVREKKFICKWWKKGGKGNGITIGLPPSESFLFIISEQDCLHTFED